jgi:hypothetical protein
MLKTVMMMLAILTKASGDPELAADLSRVILLLDFRKAYDTVSREFLFLALLKFGFSEEFVNMLRRLHDGTTARFLVNGELSDPQEVISGIRQGCPLAPLLFILAAEVLALAIRQDKELGGIRVPGGKGERHRFSAFVDDSTVFMQEAQQVPRVMNIVKQFGKLSGLQVQPTKSHLLFLNTAVSLETYSGIPVVKHADTVRYLGYAVGTGELSDVNWAARIRAVQRRLATATQLATSVENRALILNVIMMPSVLFTAAAFDMPKWAAAQIRNLQKQFLWRRSTSVDKSRHKMNPELVYTPRQAGGVGVASVQLACQTQRAKHTIQWLVQKRDIYFVAWREWMFRGAKTPWIDGVTPRKEKWRAGKVGAPGDAHQQLIGEWLQPETEITADHIQQYSQTLEELAEDSSSWTTQGEWIIELSTQLPAPRLQMTKEVARFWPTYEWTDNPWIVDKDGNMLKATKFERIRRCTIAQLRIRRTADMIYTFEIPDIDGKQHQQAKLRRWGLAILLNAPALKIGESLQVSSQLSIRHPMELSNHYTWTVRERGLTVGTTKERRGGASHWIEVEQQPNGIHWHIREGPEADRYTAADRERMRRYQQEGSIVFFAHPLVHGFPWSVKDSVANKHVMKVIKKQPFNRYKGASRRNQKLLAGLTEKVHTSTWQRAAMEQTPTQLWAHNHELTEYQVWVEYRVAMRQLNLYYAGKEQDNGCLKLEECSETKESMEHIFWECPCARACWTKIIQQWTGECWRETDIQHFQRSCASRQAPELSEVVRKRIREDTPDDEKEVTKVWTRMWRILASVCITTLWIQRNRVVFHQEEITAEASAQEFWATGTSQLRALSKRERRTQDKQIQGARLYLCQQEMEQRPREHSPQVMSVVQPPDHDTAPALLTRLRTNQTSSHL